MFFLISEFVEAMTHWLRKNSVRGRNVPKSFMISKSGQLFLIEEIFQIVQKCEAKFRYSLVLKWTKKKLHPYPKNLKITTKRERISCHLYLHNFIDALFVYCRLLILQIEGNKYRFVFSTIVDSIKFPTWPIICPFAKNVVCLITISIFYYFSLVPPLLLISWMDKKNHIIRHRKISRFSKQKTSSLLSKNFFFQIKKFDKTISS